jgi:TetR/AcrR family tetracycline transcriptional repressor
MMDSYRRQEEEVPLTQAVVLDAAVRLLDEVGLDALTTRRLARSVGVRVGALYWHFPSKQALLDAIADRIVADAACAPLPEDDWVEQMRTIAHAQRESMLAHPDGARIVATMNTPGPMAWMFIERPIAVLRAAGLSDDAAAAGTDAMTSYVNGFTIEEQARKLKRLSRTERDASFEFGLRVVLDGLRVLVQP